MIMIHPSAFDIYELSNKYKQTKGFSSAEEICRSIIRYYLNREDPIFISFRRFTTKCGEVEFHHIKLSYQDAFQEKVGFLR